MFNSDFKLSFIIIALVIFLKYTPKKISILNELEIVFLSTSEMVPIKIPL